IDALTVIEELAKECRPAAFQVFEANTGPARVLSLVGSEELQQRFLPGVISGDISIALAISEPDAGSAATDLTTRAKFGDGSYTGTRTAGRGPPGHHLGSASASSRSSLAAGSTSAGRRNRERDGKWPAGRDFRPRARHDVRGADGRADAARLRRGGDQGRRSR